MSETHKEEIFVNLGSENFDQVKKKYSILTKG